MNDAPSSYRVEQAMSAWQSARARLLNDDADLVHDEAALSELLGPEEGDVRDILSRLLRASQHAVAMDRAAKQMVDDLRARQDRYQRRNDAMRGTMFAIMDAIGERKVELPHGTLSIKAGGQIASISDEAAIPDRFVEVVAVRKINRGELLVALKDGEVIPGAELSNGLPFLMIRGK